MAFDGIWRLQDPPMSGDQIKLIQAKARKSFGSYAVPLGVVENGLYDKATADFIAEYQRRKQESGYKPILPTNATAKRGDCDFETKRALGLPGTGPVGPGPAPKYIGFGVPGTWGEWGVGPQWMAVSRAAGVQPQGVGYNTGAFLQPDPQHSYVEAVNEGVAETLRLALPDFRPKFLAGYSMGAEVVARVLAAWPLDRRGEWKGIFTFGSPSRPPGPTKFGTDHGGSGISRFYTPEWARPLEWSYDIDGDMYAEAQGLLPSFYQLATRAEASLEFAMYLFGWITGIPIGGFGGQMLNDIVAPPSPIGAGLLGVGGNPADAGFGALAGILGMITGTSEHNISLFEMIFNIPLIIGAIIQAMKFVGTNAHGKYWVDPIFEGMVAEDHAAATVRRLAV